MLCDKLTYIRRENRVRLRWFLQRDWKAEVTCSQTTILQHGNPLRKNKRHTIYYRCDPSSTSWLDSICIQRVMKTILDVSTFPSLLLKGDLLPKFVYRFIEVFSISMVWVPKMSATKQYLCSCTLSFKSLCSLRLQIFNKRYGKKL